jgi:hypothetical protein
MPRPAAPDRGPGRPPIPAAERCYAAYRKALEAAGGPKANGARTAAENAFRAALPDLTDRASTADFISCILKGMVLRIFWSDDGHRLICAARASLAACPRKVRQPSGRGPGRPPKTAMQNN